MELDPTGVVNDNYNYDYSFDPEDSCPELDAELEEEIKEYLRHSHTWLAPYREKHLKKFYGVDWEVGPAGFRWWYTRPVVILEGWRCRVL